MYDQDDSDRVYKAHLTPFAIFMTKWSWTWLPLTLLVCFMLPSNETGKFFYAIVYSVWVLAVPSWFYYEADKMFDWKHGNIDKIKTLSELGQKCWSAIIVVLGVIFIVKYDINLL